MNEPEPQEESPPADVLAELLEFGGDPVALGAADGSLRWSSAAFRRATGLVPGQRLHDLAFSGAPERIAAICAAGGCEPFDLELATVPGRVFSLRAARGAGGMLWRLADVSEARRLAERLDAAQDFGRIGVWERDLVTGQGLWDRHVFGFWGLDPAQGTPSFGDADRYIHPDDRRQPWRRDFGREPGRFSQRYRVVGADGVTRWIHSQWTVQADAQGRPQRALGIMMDDTEVYRLAQSLGDTSAQLRLAVELANIAIWRHDLTADRIHYNDRAYAVLDIPPRADGLSLVEVRALIHPDDIPTVVDSARRALESDRPTDMEARYRRSDGSWRHVLTRRVVQRGADGRALAFVGVALDVTEQVEQRRQSAELARRLEIAADAAQIGIWWRDPISGEGEWNAKMFVLTGRDPALGTPSPQDWIDTIVHPADRPRMRAAPRLLVDRPADMREHEFRIVRPDGELRWLVTRARRETWQGRMLVFGVTLDVTQRRLAEAALRSADQRAALAARGAGIGTWEVVFEPRSERWDDQMFRLRGLEPQEQTPTREQRLAMVHPEDRGNTANADAWNVADGRIHSHEFRVLLPDGGVRWLASRSTAVHDGYGHPTGRIGVNWDITEAKQGEAALREKAAAELESRAKSQFLARMSHELRTPLNAVLGFTQLLQAEAGLNAGQRTHLGHIRSAGDHLLELIDDVLDLARLESGQMRLEFESVPLRALVDEALPLVEGLAAMRGVVLEAPVVKGVARADRTRLLQVLINLLSNAVKYNRPEGRVIVEALTEGDAVRLTVADSGRGLTSEQAAHLFEPFNRLGVERENVEGSGIGLTIVKALVEGMGGTVSASSEPGFGTVFTVLLPTAREPAALPQPRGPAQASAPPPGRRASHGTILYVEDNAVNVTLVEELVRRFTDLEIVCAPDGTNGVERAVELQPDLVLIDMQLPDFDGLEVLRRLRADERTAAIPCIALSANAMPEDIARALGSGFDDYWTKPIVFRDFVASLEALFPAPRAGA